MLRKILAVLGIIVLLVGLVYGVFLLGFVAREEGLEKIDHFHNEEEGGLEMRSFLWTQDFEEADPVVFYTGGGYTINFKGLTEEKFFSGRKSFKLDVTFHDSGHTYWYIPISKVPAEGRLNFSGRIFLGEETTGWAILKTNVLIPPAYHSGHMHFGEVRKGEWRLVEEDMVKSGKGVVNQMAAYAWGATAENVGIYVDGVGLFFVGYEGQRVVVYLDDIKIEGEVPTEKAYQEEIKRRWAPVKARSDEKISSWEKILAERENEMASFTGLSGEAEKMKREVGERISSTKGRIETIKSRGFIYAVEQYELDPFLGRLKSIINNIKLLYEGNLKFKNMLLYVVPPISNLKILPFDTVIPGEISDEIRVIATPGEYEPASFVVSALSDITILAEVTDLKGEKGVIPSQNIDIKIVKCWFQGADAWRGIADTRKPGVLVPELLLNDASLVKVDFERQENYLKLSFPEGERYIWISDHEKTDGHPKILFIEEFPVKDSPVLLPVHIPARTNQQFWITVKVPDTAGAGVYTGNITLSTEKETLATLTLKLRVLPFKLASPKTHHNLEQDFISSIYYTGYFNPAYPEAGSISSEQKSKEQMRAELKNMFAHGITNPYAHHFLLDDELLGLRKFLELKEDVGMSMSGQPLFLHSAFASVPSQAKVKEIIEFVKPFGITEIYFYGKDEARGEILTAQRPAWEAVREAGGRIFVAGFKGSNFPLMGDIQDLQISAFAPCKKEAALWHSVGHRIFTYHNPQGGVEDPEAYRRGFGLLLWLANYDGAMTFAYQFSFGNIWNDFDDPHFRDHNFALPTVDGVITTIALAGYREGIDDIRYATTLRLAIEEAEKSEDRGVREKAASARRFLSELDTDRDLDTTRMEIIGHILGLLDYSPHRLSD